MNKNNINKKNKNKKIIIKKIIGRRTITITIPIIITFYKKPLLKPVRGDKADIKNRPNKKTNKQTDVNINLLTNNKL